MSDLKFWFSVVAGFSLVYAGCLWLDGLKGFSAEAEAIRRQQGWVTVIPSPRNPSPAAD